MQQQQQHTSLCQQSRTSLFGLELLLLLLLLRVPFAGAESVQQPAAGAGASIWLHAELLFCHHICAMLLSGAQHVQSPAAFLQLADCLAL
jgi:hypothetical protein